MSSVRRTHESRIREYITRVHGSNTYTCAFFVRRVQVQVTQVCENMALSERERERERENDDDFL